VNGPQLTTTKGSLFPPMSIARSSLPSITVQGRGEQVRNKVSIRKTSSYEPVTSKIPSQLSFEIPPESARSRSCNEEGRGAAAISDMLTNDARRKAGKQQNLQGFWTSESKYVITAHRKGSHSSYY
jgi:hypothetical protein